MKIDKNNKTSYGITIDSEGMKQFSAPVKRILRDTGAFKALTTLSYRLQGNLGASKVTHICVVCRKAEQLMNKRCGQCQ